MATHDRAHRASQPHADPRPCRAADRARSRREQAAVRRPVRRPRRLQGQSTTASGTAPATSCCASVAARLESTIREADTLGRLGGDEFVILVDGIALAAGPELVAERILDALKEPFVIDGSHTGHLAITASIGIAVGRRAQRRGPAARRGHRDVPRQARRQEPLRGLRDRHAGRDPHPHGDRDGSARGGGQAAVLRRLPADVRPRRAHPDPHGGAAALATDRARAPLGPTSSCRCSRSPG